jgi:hypothetical protein
MSLNIFGQLRPPRGFAADVKVFSSLPQDKLKSIIEFAIDVIETRFSVTPEIFQQRTSTSLEEGYGAYRFVTNMAEFYGTHTEEQLVEDFVKLGIPEDRFKILLDLFRSNKQRFRSYWLANRNEAVPTLTEVNWRVDIRTSSSDYLERKEAVALVRLQASDNEETSQIYFELDKEHLSFLETRFNKLKEEFLQAEKTVSTEQTSK